MEATEQSLRRPSQAEQATTLSEPIEAKVVYLGNATHKTVVLPNVTDVDLDDDGNQIHRTPQLDPEMKTLESYSFERFDSRKRLIKERLTKDGRVFTVCRNLEHLARFYEATDAEGAAVFEIRAPGAVLGRIQDYLNRHPRRLRYHPDVDYGTLNRMAEAAQGA